MAQMLKRLAAIALSVIMALTVFPLLGGAANVQTAFADDEIVQVDSSASDEDQNEVDVEENVAGEAVNNQETSKEAAQEKDKEVVKDKAQKVLKSGAYGLEIYDDEEGDLFSDGTKYLEIYSDAEDYNLEVKVGMGYGSWNNWDTLFPEGDLYTFEDYGGGYGDVELNGSAIYDQIKDTGYSQITVAAALVDDYGNKVDETAVDFNVSEPRVNYSYLDDLEMDSVLFPSEKLKIYKSFEGDVENAKYPGGKDFDCTATKVTSSDPSVVAVTSKTSYFLLTAKSYGEATVTINFKGYKKAATTRDIVIKVVDGRVIAAMIDGEDYHGIPGDSIELKADAWFEEHNGPDVWDGLDFEWSIVQNEEYADVVADPEDPSKATLTFKDGGELLPYHEDTNQIIVHVDVSYTAENGVTYTDVCEADEFWVLSNYTELTPKENSFDLGVGKKYTLEPKVTKHVYNEATGQQELTEVEDVDFTVKSSNKKYITVTNNKDGTYTLSRKSASACRVDVDAEWDSGEEWGMDEDSVEYYFSKVRTSLSSYYIEFEGSVDNWCYYIDSPEGITPNIKVRDKNNDYILPEDEYTLVIQKQTDWENDSKFETASMPFTYDYDESDLTAPGNGTAIYRVYAKATSKNKYFTGKTATGDGYIYIYSTKTLTPWAASIEVDKKYDEYLSKDIVFEGGSIVYEMPLGMDIPAEDITVKANNDKDVLNTDDFRVEYKTWDDEDAPILSEFPTETGIYDLRIVGQGEYFGMNDWITVFVGEKNPATIKAATKTVKYTKVKKKAQTVSPISVKNKLGAVSFEKVSGSKYLTVNASTGKATVKKKTKKGTYKASILVYAEGDETYAPACKLVNITVKVK